MKDAIKILYPMLVATFAFSSYFIKDLQNRVKELEARKPVIIYQVDNSHGRLIGTVTSKRRVDGHYTVTIGAYGEFLVTKEQYDSLNIGDDAPDFLKKRGN
ncbi:hypothetical protein Javan174_0028 [Streptococcus phage Javan174]|uniref:DUF1372 family protein n=1 Tax=Streptococcus entericus TaxID=155680 RepID=UPI0003688FA1|nr:DUF1372 family protein [Streptococcus entericus]QBX24094.1 hypothetical protein Javan174_0028 [Streptococcus phage Javan174]